MIRFLFNLTATQVEFVGCGVKLVDLGKWQVYVKINGVVYLRPGPFDTRGAAVLVALGNNRYADQTGMLDCQDWEPVNTEADDTILRRAFRQYRNEGRSPAVSLQYARNQVWFAKFGW